MQIDFAKSRKNGSAEKTNLHSHFIKVVSHLSRENVCAACKFVFCTKTASGFYTTSQLEKWLSLCYIIDTKGDTEYEKDPKDQTGKQQL